MKQAELFAENHELLSARFFERRTLLSRAGAMLLTAAGRKIFRDEAVIQRRQRVPVRVGRLGQKGLQLLGEG